MGMACQLSAVCAATMVALVLAAAIATLSSVVTTQSLPTPGTNCYRRCMAGDSRTCHFSFEVHPYMTMSRACRNCPRNATDCDLPECVTGDGHKRLILAINKQMPGPPIQVCEGDKVVVDVKNSLPDGGLTLHWHGLTMKAGVHDGTPYPATPHMDGPPGITQCPIHTGSSFRYTFYANHAGTHFYHAHSGFHRADGVMGPIIVRQAPGSDPNHDKFDHDLPEHVLMFHDWLHTPTMDKFALRHHGGGDDFPESMLVNGRGPQQHLTYTDPITTDPTTTTTGQAIPYTRFKVSPGKRYRFRLINSAVLNCPITVHFDQHHLTLIATDGNPINPVNGTSVVVYPGERWDVVVLANHATSRSFWISFMGGVDCAETEAHQFALLEYERPGQHHYQQPRGSKPREHHHLSDFELLRQMPRKPEFTQVPPEGTQVNSINSACYDDLICAANLRSPEALPANLRTTSANFTYYLAFEMRRIHNPHWYSRVYYDFDSMPEEQQIPTPQVNNLTFLMPSTPLLLSGGEHDSKACSAEHPMPTRTCHDDYCECLHMYHIPLGASVDLVLIDEGQYGDENHPIHLHGHYFWVLGQDRPNDVVDADITRDKVMAMDKEGQLLRNLENPVRKDTVTIPDGGYTIIRFHADNPGYWLLHCHLIFHSVAGMEVVFKVGEVSDMPPVPEGFPTCGNYRPQEL